MPKKKNFLGGMQNYNAQTGEYEPALKGPNGESPSGFKSFKKQEDKDESFDTVNKKRMGKDIDFTSEDYVDDFDANDEDSIWNAFESGKITEEERNKMLSKRSGKIANESFDTINKKRMNGGKYGSSWKEGESLSQSELEVFNEISKMKKEGNYDREKLKEKFEGITDEDIDNMEKAYQIDNPQNNESFDEINAKRMGKERAKPFKMPGTLRQRYNDYLRNGFSGKNTDKWNKEIEFIESKLPFKDEQEHQKWLDMASNWKGEPEWINMTNELIDRYNKSGEGGMDIEFRNFIKNPYDYEGTHSKDLINMVVEHGRKNYPNHPYFNKKSKLPF